METGGKHTIPLYDGPRGSPLNIGTEFSASHPVIRTNRVTGWKSVFAVHFHIRYINDLTNRESSRLVEESQDDCGEP